MVKFPVRNYAEFVFKKETRTARELYILRYSLTKTAEERTRKILENWADNPRINFTKIDASYICRQMTSIKRKSPRERIPKLYS